ncbi:hypothetical protein NL488_28315, partial [Klebsiella pneumoniae]|nr:hypothetical protein [Klebsiella pneumoniae]
FESSYPSHLIAKKLASASFFVFCIRFNPDRDVNAILRRRRTTLSANIPAKRRASRELRLQSQGVLQRLTL